MTTSDSMAWLESVKRVMEERLIEGQNSAPLPVLAVIRQGQLLCTVGCADPRLLVTDFSRVLVAGFEADELVFTSDTWMSQSPTNPEGEPWSLGEMGRRAQEPAVRALLREGLLLLRGRRDGNLESGRMAYEIKGGGRVAWEPAQLNAVFAGVFADAMRAALQEPHLSDLLKQHGVEIADFGLNTEQARLGQRVATLKHVATVASHLGVLVAFGLELPPEPWAEGWLRQSLDGSGLEVEIL